MGKAKRKSFTTPHSSLNPTAANKRKPAPALPKLSDPEIQQLRETRIYPHSKLLLSLDATERANALSEIADSLDEPQVRNLFLREKIVQYALERGVHDDHAVVRVRSWGLLRAVCREEGSDQCLFIWRQGVLVPLREAVGKVGGLLSGAQSYSAEEKTLAWEFVDNLVGILGYLAETIDAVVDAIFETEGLVPFVVHVLKADAPAFAKETAIKCLYTITISEPGWKPPYIAELLELPEVAPTLLSVLHNNASESPLLPIGAAGTIHNTANDEKAIQTDDETINSLLKGLEVAVTQMKESLRPSKAFDSAVTATEIALEIIASMAIVAQKSEEIDDVEMEEDEDEDDAMDEDEKSDDEMEDDTEEKNGKPEDDDSEEGDSDDDLPDDLLADMDAVTSVDHAPSLPPQTETYLRTLTLTTPTGLLSLISSEEFPISIRTRATNALANIAWLFSDAIPASSKLHASFVEVAQAAWGEITKIMAANTADIELADAIASLAWALSKAHVDLDLSLNQHRAFIALYTAAGSNDLLQTKCVGVLGRLALAQGQIELNKEIGTFLVTLISKMPETPLGPGLGACDAIMDIYADKAYDYDEPVFVNCGFLAHLDKAVKGVRTAVKKIDKKNRKEERDAADEVVDNLVRFIKYKRDEVTVKPEPKKKEKKPKKEKK